MSFQRWYDRQPRLSESVRILLLFPDEIKEILCEGIILLANKEFKIAEAKNSFKTVGSEKALSLHKSKNKRRDYDENATVHKTLNYLYILSENNQDDIAERILELVGFIEDYLRSCLVFEAEPSLDQVSEITHTYINRGSEEVKVFLDRIRKEFLDKIRSGDLTLKGTDFLENAEIQEEISSLRMGQRSPKKKKK